MYSLVLNEQILSKNINITLSYKKYLVDGIHKAMGYFRIQLLLIDNTWRTK